MWFGLGIAAVGCGDWAWEAGFRAQGSGFRSKMSRIQGLALTCGTRGSKLRLVAFRVINPKHQANKISNTDKITIPNNGRLRLDTASTRQQLDDSFTMAT